MGRTRRESLCQNRNPFHGRRILTDTEGARHIERVRERSEVSEPTADNIQGNSVFRNRLTVDDSLFVQSDLDLSASKSRSRSLIRQTLCSYNKNTNNDSKEVKPTTGNPDERCAGGERQCGSNEGMPTVDAKINQDDSTGAGTVPENQNVQNNCQFPQAITGIACVRMCSQCQEETLNERKCTTNQPSPGDLMEPVTSRDNGNSDTTFLTCISPGNSPRLSQHSSSHQETSRQRLWNGSNDHHRFIQRRREPPMVCDSVFLQPKTSTESKYTERGKRSVLLQGDGKELQQESSHPREDTMPCPYSNSSRNLEEETIQQDIGKKDRKSKSLTDNSKVGKSDNLNQNEWDRISSNEFGSWTHRNAFGNKSERGHSENHLQESANALPQCGNGCQGCPRSGFCGKNRQSQEEPNMEKLFMRVRAENTKISSRLIDHLEKVERCRKLENQDNCQTMASSSRILTEKGGSNSPINHEHLDSVGVQENDWSLTNKHSPQCDCRQLGCNHGNINSVSSVLSIANSDAKKSTNVDRNPNPSEARTETEDDVHGKRGIIHSNPFRSTNGTMLDHHPNIIINQQESVNTAAKIFMEDNKRCLSPFVVRRNHFANTTADCNISANARHTAFKSHYSGGYGRKKKNACFNRTNCKPRLFETEQRSHSLESVERKRYNSSQNHSQNITEENQVQHFRDESDQCLRPPLICHQCKSPLLSYPRYIPQRDKGTQTDVKVTRVIDTNLEECDFQQPTAASETNKHASWMQRLMGKEPNCISGSRISDTTHPTSLDYFFKPIQPEPMSPKSVLSSNNNGSILQCHQNSSSKGEGMENSGWNNPLTDVSRSSTKSRGTVPASPPKENRRTASSTTIPVAAFSGVDQTRSVRTCRSLSSLIDKNQSSFPHDNSGVQTASGNRYSIGSMGLQNTWDGSGLDPASDSTRSNPSQVNVPADKSQGPGGSVPFSYMNLRGNRNSSNTSREPGVSNTFIGEYLHNLWENQYLCDVAVTVGTKQMMAHKIVLAAFSDAFCPSSPFTKPTVCFNIPDSTPEAVYQIFRYMYTSSMDINDDNLEAALRAALFMGVTEVVDIIKGILQQPQVHNIHTYARLSQQLSMPFDVSKTAVARERLNEMVKSEYFPEMSFAQFLAVLEEPNVMVRSEEDTLLAVISWLENNPQEMPRAHELLDKLVLESIPAKTLGKYVDEHPEVFSQCGVLGVMTKAFRHHAIKSEADNLQSIRSGVSRSRFGSTTSKEPISPGAAGSRAPGSGPPRKQYDFAYQSNNSDPINKEKSPSMAANNRTGREGAGNVTFRSSFQDMKKPEFRGSLRKPYETTPEVKATTGPKESTGGKTFSYISKTQDSDVSDSHYKQEGRQSDFLTGRTRGDPCESQRRSTARRLEADMTRKGSGICGSINRENLCSSNHTRSSLLPRRWQRLKFSATSASGAPRSRAVDRFAFNKSDLASQKKTQVTVNNNHNAREHPDTHPLNGSESPMKKGDRFWCRPVVYSESSNPGMNPRRQITKVFNLSKQNNNNTNHPEKKLRFSDQAAVVNNEQTLQLEKVHADRARRSVTPLSQRSTSPCQAPTRREINSWKKRYLRRQKARFRLQHDKSPSLKMFERALSKKKGWHDNKMSKNARYPRSHGSIVSRFHSRGKDATESLSEESMSPKSHEDDALSDEMKASFTCVEGQTVNSNENCDESINPRSKKTTQSSTTTRDGKKTYPNTNLPDSTKRDGQNPCQIPSVQLQADPSQSLSSLGHDDRTSAFKKFIRK